MQIRNPCDQIRTHIDKHNGWLCIPGKRVCTSPCQQWYRWRSTSDRHRRDDTSADRCWHLSSSPIYISRLYPACWKKSYLLLDSAAFYVQSFPVTLSPPSCKLWRASLPLSFSSNHRYWTLWCNYMLLCISHPIAFWGINLATVVSTVQILR